jgi:hypothetical protein
MTGSLTGCSRAQENPFDIRTISSFREIPDVTDEEIKAIEAVLAQRDSFSFGMPFTTETFTLPDGSRAGFIPGFCNLLEDLFGIPFNIELHTMDSLNSGMANGLIDFSGNWTKTPERSERFYMSLPIASHRLAVLTYDDFIIVKNELLPIIPKIEKNRKIEAEINSKFLNLSKKTPSMIRIF